MTDHHDTASVTGWKCVPVEPTPEMIKAAFESGFVGTEDHLRKDYRAMLAASPAPSREGTIAGDDLGFSTQANER